MKKYDVVIIGCSGFLAGHLVPYLLESGKRILGIGPDCPNYNCNEFDYLKCDLLHDNFLMIDDLVEFDVLIYNAVKKGRYNHSTSEWSMQGLISAPDFFKLFRKTNISRLITIGSSEEYGPRDNDQEICESDLVKPVSSYGYWKTVLFENAKQYASSHNIQHVHLRPFVVYGQGQDQNMFLHGIIQSLLKGKKFPMTKGQQFRCFVGVSVVCYLIGRLVNLKQWEYNIINVGSPVYIQIVEAAKIIHNIIGFGELSIGELDYRENEVWHQKPSIDKMMQLIPDLGFNSFEKDIGELINYYKYR